MPTKKPKYILLLKHTVYCVLLLLLYVVQTTPRLFVIAGVKPLWVIPLAIAVAMHEGEFVGGIYGAIAGLLCDMSGSGLFGFNGALCFTVCIAVGLLIIYLMQRNVAGCLLFVFFTMLARGSIGYLFAYGIWDYASAWKIYTYQTLPVAVYTTVVSVFVYYLMHMIYERFNEALKP